jgi:pyridoxal phosphate enzyme (YggS family)
MAEVAEVSRQLRENLTGVEERIEKACQLASRPRESVKLVAITKYVDVATTRLLREAGVTCCGESRPQVLWDKATALPEIEWHLVGHLQRNKVARTLPLARLIHSVDSHRLLLAIEEEAKKLNRVQEVLLELHLTSEETKSGFTEDEWPRLPEYIGVLQHVRVSGLMAMAALDGTIDEARRTFERLRLLRDDWYKDFRLPHEMTELSMGMTHDFEEAIMEGATLIRVGSALFAGIAL